MFKNGLTLSKNRNITALMLSLLIFVIIFGISATNFLYIFDKKISTLYFMFNDIDISKNIIVVEIDEETLSGRKGKNQDITIEGLGRFPFDRSNYATVIDNLNNAGVAVIALDIIFGEKSNEISDDIFSKSIKNAGNVILGLWTNSAGIIQTPYYKFGDYILTSGYYSPLVDSITNTVYSIKPYSQFEGSNEVYNHFSIAIIRGFYSVIYKDNKYLTQKHVNYPKVIKITDKITLDRSRDYKNESLINYTYSSRYNKVSFLDIYNNNFNKDEFKDKIIIIGATAKGIKDIFNTPLGTDYGVYTHVNMVNTILTKNGVRYFNQYLEWVLIFLIIIVSVYFNISRSSYVLAFSNIAVISLFILSVLYLTLIVGVLLNYPIELAIALIISLALSNIVKYMIENKHKTKLNKALSEYVSADVASEILSGAGKINLNGENKKISIFFSDIEGFTSISEKFSPEELVAFLREYLSSMSNIIMDNKGFINKYEGDAIMALWGVFGDKSKDDSYNICFSSLKQQEKLKELNKEWSKRGFSEIKVRIGIHIGNAIIGNIGSEGRKMEFTALGDNVNIASRLEGVNKFYGTYLCASETIYEIEKDNFEFRYLDQIKVKGKKVPIKIYELLGIKKEVDSSILEIRDLFEKAVSLYLNRDFIGAKEIFEKLVNSGDNAGRMYIDMCNIYIKTPPKSDWNGISVMNSK